MTPNYHPTLVWQPFLRILHWIIAITITILLPLGILLAVSSDLKIPDRIRHEIMEVHATVGFVFAGALVLRIIYMFASHGTAGWRDVVPHTRAQLALAWRTVAFYLSGFRGTPPLYFSHNPFAGAAYTAFFIFAANQAITGVSMFVLSESGRETQPEVVAAMHAIGAILILLFIFAHFGALALHEIVERRGLASSMISGYKFFSDEETAEFEQEKKRGR